MAQALLSLGVNYRTAPLAVRERLAFGEDEVIPALGRLKQGASEVEEAALISTCNRVEIVTVSLDAERAAAQLRGFLSSERGVDPRTVEPVLYRFEGREAARHLFRVGASLDSMVLGEPQILGQLKLAYAQAAEAGTVGLVLHRAFHRAFSVAKRVRERTLIGRGSVSISSSAIALARQIFDSMHDKKALLMGAGEMAELTARQLSKLGVESLLITNRTFERAAALARRLGGTAVPIDGYKPYLKLVDIVIGSMAASHPVLGCDDVAPLLRERKYKPMFLIDLGVPRNFDAGLNDLDNVYLYDIDALSAIVTQRRGEREHEAQKAELIVETELEAFWRWLSGLQLVPAIKDIKANVERLREVELERHRAWLATLAPGQRAQVEKLTRGIVNKILHQILSQLRLADDSIDRAGVAELARKLLGNEWALTHGPQLTDASLDLGDDSDEEEF